MMKRTLKHRATALFLMIATLLTVVYPSYAVEVTSQGTNQSHITDQNDTIYTSEGTEPYFRYEPDVMAQQYVEDSRIPARSGKILDYVNADEFKTAGHTIRLEEFEELNTYVFQNSDGTRSVYIMDENVKYVDKDGAVKEKDLTLLKKGNGYGITQSDIELFLPDNPAQGIDLGFSGYEIKLTPKTQNLSKVKTTAEKRDNSVVYTDYFGKDISLVYTPLLSGVKEDIVLYSYKENQSYKFDLETDGLKVYSDRNGYYLAENAKSECIFRLGEIILYDDVGKPGTGNMTVETVTEGEKYLLTVTADEAFLTDETTVYPVTIDPGILVSDNDTGTNSIVDCPIFEGFPNSSFGAYT